MTTRRTTFAAAAGLMLAGLGLAVAPASANTGTCHNKTYRCKGRKKVLCTKGSGAICTDRHGNYKGAATLI